jgi:hypothetical protein
LAAELLTFAIADAHVIGHVGLCRVEPPELGHDLAIAADADGALRQRWDVKAADLVGVVKQAAETVVEKIAAPPGANMTGHRSSNTLVWEHPDATLEGGKWEEEAFSDRSPAGDGMEPSAHS